MRSTEINFGWAHGRAPGVTHGWRVWPTIHRGAANDTAKR